ncbi:transcriptional regulator, HxlR family [Luteibacter sp. 22Crub2.1]|nr:transcriptional regulator, HxlR family [Luteibacter sp. 22Crub2.1]
MLQGRWKLPILFRLYADTTLRTLELKRSLAGISQKMLTQHLRELQADGLIHRMELPGTVRGVAYALTEMGQGLVPVLTSAREFSIRFAARHATVTRSARSEAGSRQHR